MASSYPPIIFRFIAQGGNVNAVLGQIAGGFSNVTRVANTGGQSMGFFGRQLRTIATTMRYAFAGEVVFRIRQTVVQLREFQDAMAGVAAIGQQGLREANPGAPLNSAQFSRLQTAALRLSTQTAQPASDIAETMRAIYSSIPTIKGTSEVQELASIATKGAGISETDPRTYIQALIGMNNAFSRSVKDTQNTADQFFTVIQDSINMSGDEWAKYSGRLVAASNVAGLSLEQMNALMVAMTERGGTAAVNIRHLAQLMQRIRFPTATAQKAYAAAGLSKAQLSNMNGMDVFRALLAHAESISGNTVPQIDPTKLKNMTDQQRNARLAGAAQSALKGPGLQFLQQAVGGRMEAFRAFITIAPQLDFVNRELHRFSTATGRMNAAFDRFIEQQPLTSLSVSLNTFGVGLLARANPLFQALARAARAITAWSLGVPHIPQLLGHSTTGKSIQAAGLALGGIASIAGIRRLLSNRAMRNAAARATGQVQVAGKAAGGLARPLLDVEALPAAVAGTGNGSRAAPLWVIIHPLSWTLAGGAGPGGMPTGNGGGGGNPLGGAGTKKLLERVLGTAGAARIIGMFGGAKALATRAFWPAAVGIMAYTAGKDYLGMDRYSGSKGFANLYHDLGSDVHGVLGLLGIGGRSPIQMSNGTNLSNAFKGPGGSRNNASTLQFGGLSIDVIVKPSAELKKYAQESRTRVHVKPKLHSDGAPAPHTRGRPGTANKGDQ